ncbi:hypothetical protein AeNC1_002252 [Aphanomyces euteiches]|nr:hypothetical protein AeNC1_002252 [Aphanomyces euteiches]
MQVDLKDDLFVAVDDDESFRSTLAVRWNSHEDVKASTVNRMRKLLLLPDASRTADDYEFMDRFVLYIRFFVDVDPVDRLQYLKVTRGVSLSKGEILFSIGDPADTFFCVISGSLHVVVDLTRVHLKSKRDLNDIMNRVKVYSCLHNPGVGLSESPLCTSYVVRRLKRFDSFGDVGMLTTSGVRTASVVACEDSFLLAIDRSAFLDCRVFRNSKEINQKLEFLHKTHTFRHWDRESKIKLCGRMERVLKSYNDVVVAQNEDVEAVYMIQLGDCRLVKHVPKLGFVELATLSSGQCFGSYEVVRGLSHAACSVIVASPSAILYRVDKVDFRHHILRDSVVELIMKADADDLYARMHPESIQRDLQHNAQWQKCKQSILTDATPRRQARPVYLAPFNHSLHPPPLAQPPPELPRVRTTSSPRKLKHRQSKHHAKKQPAIRSAERPMSVATAAQKLYLGHQFWIQWAGNRMANVTLADSQEAPSPSSSRRSSYHRTQSSQCMRSRVNSTQSLQGMEDEET